MLMVMTTTTVRDDHLVEEDHHLPDDRLKETITIGTLLLEDEVHHLVAIIITKEAP